MLEIEFKLSWLDLMDGHTLETFLLYFVWNLTIIITIKCQQYNWEKDDVPCKYSNGFQSVYCGFIFDFLLKKFKVTSDSRYCPLSEFKYQEVKDKYDTYSPQTAHKMHTFVLT